MLQYIVLSGHRFTLPSTTSLTTHNFVPFVSQYYDGLRGNLAVRLQDYPRLGVAQILRNPS